MSAISRKLGSKAKNEKELQQLTIEYSKAVFGLGRKEVQNGKALPVRRTQPAGVRVGKTGCLDAAAPQASLGPDVYNLNVPGQCYDGRQRRNHRHNLGKR